MSLLFAPLSTAAVSLFIGQPGKQKFPLGYILQYSITGKRTLQQGILFGEMITCGNPATQLKT
jgi:hypothetical protein